MVDSFFIRIVKQFQITGKYLSAQPYGSGHLHDTYLVKIKDQKKNIPTPYIFQRINHKVFRDPPALMENILRVTRHIRQKLVAGSTPGNEICRRVLTVIHTHDGNSYYRDPQGIYWRAFIFIDKAKSCDTLQSNDQAFQVAFMFGQFLEMLRDFPGPPLHETIPGFHHGPKRLKDFQEALASDSHNRATSAKEEIDFLLSQASLFAVIPNLIQKGEIPVRVTHNDTKVNNVMLDETTGEGLCVIDLDTVMPGVSLYDFGDLARSALSSTGEDERDSTNLSVDMSRFESILKGFLSGTKGILTKTEKEHLVFSAKLMPLLIGMRFLTDYLQGDTYFKIHRKDQNLDRCRRQLILVESIIGNEEEMKVICLRRPKTFL